MKRSGVSVWIWVALVVVLAVGATSTYLLLRQNDEAVASVEEVEFDQLTNLIQEGNQLGVYFYSPT